MHTLPPLKTKSLNRPCQLPNNAIHKSLLHPRNLALKLLHLPPTIQRPPIMDPQTRNHPILRLLHPVIQLHQLTPSLQLRPQRLNLPIHRLRIDSPIDGLVHHSDRGRVTPRKRDPWRIEVQRPWSVRGSNCWCGSGCRKRRRIFIFDFG